MRLTAIEWLLYGFAGGALLYAATGWFAMRRRLSGQFLLAVGQMFRMLLNAKQAQLLAAMAAAAVLAVVGATMWPVPAPAVAVAIVAACLAACLRAIQPPAVLFLTASSPATARLLILVNRAIRPLRAVALLDHARMSTWQRWNSFNDNLRTTDDARLGGVWKNIVYRLIDMATLVVIDTRGETDPVRVETFVMLDPQRVSKAIFITGPEGNCPALERLGIDPQGHALTLVSEDQLVPELQARLQASLYEVRPQRVVGGTLLRESWDTLPSIEMEAFPYGFDSDAVVQAARTTTQELLNVWTGAASDPKKVGDWSLHDLSWEFAHNPSLAVMVLQKRGQLLIRAAFLREFGDEIGRHMAEYSSLSPTAPPVLRVAELLQPSPVVSAVNAFAAELITVANRRGYAFRCVRL